MIRPVDVLLEFLATEHARGVSHVHLDEAARDGLRELFNRTRAGGAQPAPEVREAAPLEQVAEPAAPIQPPVETPISVPAGSGGSRAEQLAALAHQAENWRPARSLGTLRETLVFGSGNPEARVMVVGEAPGYQEEKDRLPFVGPAGQKLNDILKAMGLPREEVYLTHIVKFRPLIARQATNNRKPTAEEMASCLPFIRAEVGIIQPDCIIAVGESAAEGLLGLRGTVPECRGVWHEFEGTPVRVTYHPSYLLQSGSVTNVKREVWEDMLAVMEKIGLPISDKQRGYFLPKP